MAKTNGHFGRPKSGVGMLSGSCLLLAMLAWASVTAQQPSATAPGDAAQLSAQQPLDLQEAVARDVLQPMQAGIQTQNVNQVLAVFNAQSFPDFPRFRDQLRAFLDSYSAVQFRYKILQANSSEEGRAAVTCEADLDATPLDDGQVPLRRSTQLQLQLKRTPKGWQVSGLTPSDFFAQSADR